MELKTNSQIELAHKFLQSTGVNIFLTGKAGTGKTTFLREAVKKLNKRVVIAAPTGVAALNAGGVTLHSLFQLPFGPYIPGSEAPISRRFTRHRMALIRSIELLVIDEISMVRGDILDSVDATLKRIRRNNRPFGGVQLLMIGDIQQLSPICRDEEWTILQSYYQTPYFFDSIALKSCNYITIEFEQIFRQSDVTFTALLNAIRENRANESVINELNKRYIPDFTPPENEEYITLTTHNNSAHNINYSNLSATPGESKFYKAAIDGDFPESIYPNDTSLELKVGAQVMFTKNGPSPEKQFYNGMLGSVTEMSDKEVKVKPRNGGEEITISAMRWENIEYNLSVESGNIEENIKGSFDQLPLKCAWAITIHKSQGLSFDRAIIDASGSFAHGQVYVALSRCRTLEGLVLRTPLRTWSIISDNCVKEFSDHVSANQPSNDQLELHKRQYYIEVLNDIFSFSNISRTLVSISNELNVNLYRQYPRLCDRLMEELPIFKEGVVAVGANFIRQLQSMITQCDDYNTNPLIAERLSKSSKYFLPKVSPLTEIAAEIAAINPDSKSVKKQLDRYMADLKEELMIKVSALELCAIGFSVADYQQCKARVFAKGAEAKTSERAKREEKPKTVLKIPRDVTHSELYETLVEWRKEEADDKPLYTVVPNKVLMQIQALLPTSTADLKLISGVGPKIIEKYGKVILSIVAEYCMDNHIDPDAEREASRATLFEN